MTSTPTSRRAPAMAPADRRRAIIGAALPLLEKYGSTVTTRQIADAAGIAEGTIFRAFPDKESLIREALEAAFDPETALIDLDSVDAGAALEPRLLAIVGILQKRLENIFALITRMGLPPPTGSAPNLKGQQQAQDDPIITRLEDLLRPDASALRFDVPRAVVLLRLVLFAGTHPRITNENPLSAEQIVDLFLHGSLVANTSTPPPGAHTC